MSDQGQGVSASQGSSEGFEKTLLIVDMSALAFRSHYALLKRPLTRSDGMVTSALFGICNTLLNVIEEFKPTHVVGALDSKEKNFRHEMFTEYKAHRPECPPELAAQLECQEELLEAMGMSSIRKPGFEADDIVGVVTKMAQSQGMKVIIFSGDKDFMQLLDDKTMMLLSHRGGESELLKGDGVKEKIGVEPHQVADFLALMGDSADNIPGAPGVGKVTAAQLLAEYGDLNTILDSTHLMKKKGLAAKLSDNREQVVLSRRLVALAESIPDMPDLPELQFAGIQVQKALPFLKKMEFPKIVSRLGAMASVEDVGGAAVAKPSLPSEKAEIHSFENLSQLTETLQSLSGSASAYWAMDHGACVALAISQENRCWWISLKAQTEMFMDPSALLGELLPSMAHLDWITQDAKWMLKHAQAAKVALSSVDDVSLMDSVLYQSGREASFDALVLKELGISLPDFGKKGNKKNTWSSLLGEELGLHLADRCLCLEPMAKLYGKALEEKQVLGVYEQMERPLLDVVSGMESRGIAMEMETLERYSKEFEIELDELTQTIYGLAGEEFNIKSTQQLGQVLFEKLKLQDELKLKKLKKTKTGYSTDSKVLESLKGHPIGEALLRYRFLSKLKSTYLDALPKQVNEQTGRVHTTYHQNGTATGRLSSQDPNLQNIPMRVPEGAKIRGAFVPAEGHVLMAADYSQIELRVLAYFCQDEVMLEAYQNGEDIHAATAAKVYGISQDWVTPQQRSSAKAVNFGLLYGMGPKLLSQQTGLTFSEAQKFIKAYFESFPRVRTFMTEQVEKARAAGYVTTLSGRRRDLPDLESSNGMLRNAAENMALNTPIQGSAADIIKWSMLRLSRKIKDEAWPVQMLLQVHDELVFEMPADQVEKYKALIVAEMESLVDLPTDFNLPLTVEVGVGADWLEAHA